MADEEKLKARREKLMQFLYRAAADADYRAQYDKNTLSEKAQRHLNELCLLDAKLVNLKLLSKSRQITRTSIDAIFRAPWTFTPTLVCATPPPKQSPRLQDGDVLLKAAASGDTHAVKSFIVMNPTLINSRDSIGWTASHYAVAAGHEAVLKILAKQPYYDPNVYNKQAQTPLSMAIQEKQWGAARILLGVPQISLHNITAFPGLKNTGIPVDISSLLRKIATQKHSTPKRKISTMLTRAFAGMKLDKSEPNPEPEPEPNPQPQPVPLLPTELYYHMLETFSPEDVAKVISSSGTILQCALEIPLCLSNTDGEGNSVVHYLAREGAVNTLRHVFGAHGVNPNATNKHNWTPLTYAFITRQDKMTEFLCQYPYTDLTIGAIVTYSLEVDGAVFSEVRNGVTPLHVAVSVSNARAVDLILAGSENDPVMCNIRDTQQETPLHYATLHNVHGMVEHLKKKPGVDINSQNITGATPLHLACEYEKAEDVVVFCDDMETNLNSEDVNGNTPLIICARTYRNAAAFTLLKYNQDIDINHQNNRGHTALMKAALSGNDDLIAQLLKLDLIDVNERDNDWCAAIHYACINTLHPSVASILCADAEVDVNMQTGGDLYTPLHACMHANNRAAARELLKRPDLDVTLKDIDGMTPLQLAISLGEGRKSIQDLIRKERPDAM